MKLNNKAVVFDLNDKPCTRMVVAAHEDDIEIMCGDGIARCYDNPDEGLVAVVVTDGGGSPRAGKFKHFTYDQMVEARKLEQYNVAVRGRYSKLIMLGYTSAETNGAASVADDIAEIMREYPCTTLYSHNPADKHRTHVNVFKHTVNALRKGNFAFTRFYGCECWRGLDWLNDDEKVIFDVTGYGELLTELLNMHVSQVEGGKRYDLAADGRRRANATFMASHAVDTTELCSYGIDLTEVLRGADPKELVFAAIDRFKNDVLL